MLKYLLIKDSKDKKSLTASAFFYGFLIVNLKLLSSGLTVGSVTLSPFSGSEYALAVGALGGIYILRRSTNNKDSKNDAT